MDDQKDDLSNNKTTNFHFYSDKYPFCSDSDEDSADGVHFRTNFSFNDASSNYQKTPRIFDRFYNSSSDDEGDISSSSSYQRRLDYMLQFLDRKLSIASSSDQPLPEVVAAGGGTGIFKLPARAPVHPNRPPSLEIRPHPLRETQVARFLRNILCVNDDDNGPQLWAGTECGVRVWDLNIDDMYGGQVEDGELEEEGTARYWESAQVESATMCMVGDGGSRALWTGHKDGRIRCWKMMDFFGSFRNGFQEVLAWQAHHGPVLSIVALIGNLRGNPLPALPPRVLRFEGINPNANDVSAGGGSAMYVVGESSAQGAARHKRRMISQGNMNFQGENFMVFDTPGERYTIYDNKYEEIGLPMDPHIRAFLASNANGNRVEGSTSNT